MAGLTEIFTGQKLTHVERANTAILEALSRATVSKDLTDTNTERGKDGRLQPKTLFNLFHPFANVLPALIEKYARSPEKKRLELIKKDLVSLLTYQLNSYLAEILRTPLSTTPLNLRNVGNGMYVDDPRYAHGDVLDQTRNSLAYAEENDYENSAGRYKLELEQWEVLIESLKDSLPHAILEVLENMQFESADELPEGWSKNTSNLPDDLCNRYSIPKNTPAFLGPRKFTVMPQNTSVYEEGMAYWNMYVVVYIPSLPPSERFHLVLNQFFNKFNYADHTNALTNVHDGEDSLHLSNHPNEAEIMHTVALPDATFATLDPARIMAELSKKVGRGGEVHEVMVAQQQAVAAFQQRAIYIEPAAEYMAEVFLEEFNRYAQGKSTFDEISEVLKATSEVVLNPLLRGDVFDQKLATQKYYKNFKPRTRKLSDNIFERIGELQNLRDTHIKSFDGTSMIGVLQRAVSILDCSKGIYGGLAAPDKLASLLTNPSFSQFANTGELLAHLRSSDVTREELYEIIGERANNFHPGVCGAELRGKGFHVGCGKHTLIGECGLCLGCEMGSSFPDMPARENPSGGTSGRGENSTENSDEVGSTSARKNHLTVNDGVFLFVSKTNEQRPLSS